MLTRVNKNYYSLARSWRYMNIIQMYISSECSPFGGGWAVILSLLGNPTKRIISGYEDNATYDSLAQIAAISAVNVLKDPCYIRVYSDNKDLISTMRGESPKRINLGLWKTLEDTCSIHSISWIWVKKGITPLLTQAHSTAVRAMKSHKGVDMFC